MEPLCDRPQSFLSLGGTETEMPGAMVHSATCEAKEVLVGAQGTETRGKQLLKHAQAGQPALGQTELNSPENWECWARAFLLSYLREGAKAFIHRFLAVIVEGFYQGALISHHFSSPCRAGAGRWWPGPCAPKG